MVDAWNWALSVLTSCWNWLSSWQWHGVSFAYYLVGFVILDILISRIFN